MQIDPPRKIYANENVDFFHLAIWSGISHLSVFRLLITFSVYLHAEKWNKANSGLNEALPPLDSEMPLGCCARSQRGGLERTLSALQRKR